ncbi:D-alanyl-D-alanine carboxypeptidase family protein [Rhodobaculum claviforme]|uniref:serine-type D-Ala-D-Ala carboxypeptidase n=1 Tax=Rhodobaculum claviforme TaxID=1549854 RepID=A0A934WIU9_9RHOB|nr:D-alanyl-D-alanine carboxypeptidase family protein [Rhodobaculum claviforme]MBK5928515.1 D-alanyl-D-alanine carboxypeptidase [Rhodobaculum claviforme]
MHPLARRTLARRTLARRIVTALQRPLPRALPHVLAAAVAAALATPAAASFETRATSAIVVDFNTGTILLEKDADTPLPPASMSKLMTLNMVFEAIEDGRLSLDTTLPVSTRAREMGGSRMFVEERHRPTVEDLIRGIAVLSGNDATVVVAEGLAGTEENFARQMTERARALGMTGTTLMNASGWPHPQHRMSKRDLAILSERLIRDFPQYYPYLSELSFTWNDITQSNRVPLLTAGIGLDGLKTGFTSAAGFSLAGSAEQGGRRVIFVIGGLGSERERAEEAERIINWAFRQFAERRVLAAGARVAEAEVWLGEARQVGLVVPEDLVVLVPALQATDAVTAEVVYDGPLEAPVRAGQRVGELVVTLPDLAPLRVPLVAESDVGRGNFAVRVQAAAGVLWDRARAAMSDRAAGL